ncbi:hypothetical protein DY000_02030090 [Brassica cretica]|uniref:Uncharacterized protein n=1 Tax=Brassica cretica TaxID=69181 RepID=A0ABQ7DRB6_BRACR|nr:hypothetical protein DY000_02030090 [Brassica cretica]
MNMSSRLWFELRWEKVHCGSYSSVQQEGARHVLPDGDGKKPQEKGRLRPVQKERSKKSWCFHVDGAIA